MHNRFANAFVQALSEDLSFPISIRGKEDGTKGEITGSYIDSNNVNHGFIRDRDGSITTFDAPEAGTTAPCGGTYPFSNNSTHVIAGWYIDANCVFHGFLRVP